MSLINLVHVRDTVSRTMQQQIDDHLQQVAEWLVSFSQAETPMNNARRT